MRTEKILAIIIASSIVAGVIVTILTAHKFPHYDFLRQAMLGLSGTMAILSIGAGILFLLGRKDFKAGPRKAYTLLCVGIMLLGFSQVQPSIIEYFDLRFLTSTGWAGLLVVPYLLSVVFTIWGMRILAQSVNIKTRWASLPLAIFTAFAVAALSMLVPHASFEHKVLVVVQVNSFFAVGLAVVYLFAARLAWIIRQVLGPLYKPAMVWLFVSLVVVAFGAVNAAWATRFFHNSWYEQDNLKIVPVFFASTFFLAAGYSTLIIRRKFETDVVTFSGQNVLLGVVLYAASLASRPGDIDPILDTVRAITATNPNANFTPEQEQKLGQTYAAIENYLITNEPLRPFDTASLREQITRRFKLDPTMQSRLWQQVPSSPSQ